MRTGRPDESREPNPFDEDEIGPTRVRDPISGKKAGEYLLGARLGQGAMGVVYKATHPILGREAAIKLLHGESPDAAQKLLDEARAVARARHPNIIDIFGFGTTDEGQAYFVMELLEGEPLDLWLRNRPPLTPGEAVGILKQLFSGLAAAHAANVIHRDLKPSNLFMARLADGTHFLKILDFGLSKRVDPSAPEHTLGTITGTPLYMAPEQTVGDPSTPATDLYAAGCIAYELLAGHPPFSSASVEELLRHQRETPPPPLAESLPLTLRELVVALLEKVPSRRLASASEVRQRLERIERKLIAASPSGVLPPLAAVRPPKPIRPAPVPEARPTVRLEEGRVSPSGSQRVVSSSQERPTVRMEPLVRQASSSSKLPPAPAARPTVILPELKVEKKVPAPPAPPVADTAAELVPVPARRRAKTWVVVLVVVVLAQLAVLAVLWLK